MEHTPEEIQEAFNWAFYRFQLDELENEIVASFAVKKGQTDHFLEDNSLYDKKELLNYLSINLGFGENGLNYKFLRQNKLPHVDIMYRYLKAHRLLVERFFVERAFNGGENEKLYFLCLQNNLPLIKDMIKSKIDYNKQFPN